MTPRLEQAHAALRTWREKAGARCIDAYLGPSLTGGHKCRLEWDGGKVVRYHWDAYLAVAEAFDETPWELEE